MSDPHNHRYDPNDYGTATEMQLREDSSSSSMAHDVEDAPGTDHEARERPSSMRDRLPRLPESLNAIKRDISRTIERAISTKSVAEDKVVSVKVSPEADERLDQLVHAGVFRSRAEAASYLIDEGIHAQAPLFARVEQKLAEIDRLRAELRGLVNENPE